MAPCDAYSFRLRQTRCLQEQGSCVAPMSYTHSYDPTTRHLKGGHRIVFGVVGGTRVLI